MGFDKLSEEARKKLYSCETPEELIEAAAECDIELSEQELSMINGGTDSFRSLKETLIILPWIPHKAEPDLPDKENGGYYIPD